MTNNEDESKKYLYEKVFNSINVLIENEIDLISVMSTISCELYQSFEHWNWVGFYRLIDSNTLKVGPYQGKHGCLTIDIQKGVCGKCVREEKTQIENDVSNIPYHIACSSETKSEIVIPVKNRENEIRAVLDIDAERINSFDQIDQIYLEKICALITKIYQ